MKIKRMVAFIIVLALMLVNIVDVTHSMSYKHNKKLIFGDFSLYVTDGEHPFITHTKELGITVYKVDFNKETKKKKIILDKNGEPIICSPSEDMYIENLLDGFKYDQRCNSYKVSKMENVSKLYLGILVDYDFKVYGHRHIINSIPEDETAVEILFLTQAEKIRLGYDEITDGSIYFMDQDFNYMCYRYEDRMLSLYEQMALNPDLDYGSYPTLLKDITIPNEWDWTENVSKGYLWLQPSTKSSRKDGEKGFKVERNLNSASKILMVNAPWFIHINYGVETYDSEWKEPTEHTLYKLRELGDREIETIKVRIKVGDKIAIINDTKEYEFSETPYGNSMVPLFDLCEIFKMKYHYRPFDRSVLVERFR